MRAKQRLEKQKMARNSVAGSKYGDDARFVHRGLRAGMTLNPLTKRRADMLC